MGDGRHRHAHAPAGPAEVRRHRAGHGGGDGDAQRERELVEPADVEPRAGAERQEHRLGDGPCHVRAGRAQTDILQRSRHGRSVASRPIVDTITAGG